jgi:uncharacterized protein YgbK (DUF1537 family)
MDALGTDFTIATPGFPRQRPHSVQGTPVRRRRAAQRLGHARPPADADADANLVRVLQAQMKRRSAWSTTARGARPGRPSAERFAALRQEGVQASPSSTRSPTTTCCGRGLALADLPLVTAGSGVAIGLPQNFGLREGDGGAAATLPAATRPARHRVGQLLGGHQRAGQVPRCRRRGLRHRPAALAGGADVAARRWPGPVAAGPGAGAGVCHGGAPRCAPRRPSWASKRAGALVELALAGIARGWCEQGVGQLVVAGGETSGACVQALDICASCRSGRRSRPACRGAMPARSRPPRACTSR